MTTRRRLLGLGQKVYDLADYVNNRWRMKLRFHANRIRHRRVLDGQVGRILVVRLASIGDVVRASAVVRELRMRYPKATIDFLTTDATLPVIHGNPALNAVYTLRDLRSLSAYDWVINLQNRDPPESLLQESGLTYPQILEELSSRLGGRLISGRHIEDGREIIPTNILYCVAEVEDLFLTALLRYDPARYPKTEIHVDESSRFAAKCKFSLPADLPVLAIFLGSNSVGCGADEGFRTYSLDFIEQLIRHFENRFTIVMIGQSHVRNPLERQRYAQILNRFPRVIDLVDKTSLMELVCLMDAFTLLISCDSSPVHIAIARKTPVIGLYVHDATFRLGPTLENERFVALNSSSPCFRYSWRWKFFCQTCRDAETRAHYCRNQTFVFGVDAIPIARIEEAADRLLRVRS